jgi:hypothetical protein
MNDLLLHLALLTVGAYGLIVGTVLFTVPLDVDCLNVDGSSYVVFIINTTHSLLTSSLECKRLLRCRLGRGAGYW